jgi:glycosyltransferase involved in cell wall biosynthesis
MKVAIIAPGLPNKGGAARFTWEFSEYLASQNDDVTIISLYSDRDLFKEKNNLKIIDLADKNSMTQSIKFWVNLSKTRRKIKQLINNLNPDVILFMNFPATLWAQKFGKIPVLCYPQDINLLYTNTYIKNLSKGKYFLWIILRQIIRKIDKNRWKNFDEIICHSNFSAENISKTYNVETKIIFLGTRTNIFRPTSKQKKNVILSIAAQKTQRNEFLIYSIEKLLKEENNFELWIVGSSGEHDEELKKIVKDLKLLDKIKFFGKVSDEELIDLYSQSLAVIHLVKQPPFGLIVTESMACETPVIACHPGGTDETIIHNETGFLINENDQNAIIKYIKKFLEDPELSMKMGKKGRERIQKFFELNSKNGELRLLMKKWISDKSEKGLTNN